MKTWHTAAGFLCFFISLTVVSAAECDNFTPRFEEFTDVAEEINFRANAYIDEALTALNARGECGLGKKDEEALYEELRRYFANHEKGKLVRDILYTHEVPKVVTPFRESIYKEWNRSNGLVLGWISPTIRVGTQIVGVDKLEHMFGMGLRYFKAHYFKHDSLKSVLKHGIMKEKLVLGGNRLETGVFSYGDLSANFNGMRFWNHMLQLRPDVLGPEQNLGPYISCNGGKWVQVKTLDFRNYLDATMNESINCSKYSTQGSLRKFQDSMVRLGYSPRRDVPGCPADPAAFANSFSKYSAPTQGDKKERPISHWILNEDGPGEVSWFNEF